MRNPAILLLAGLAEAPIYHADFRCGARSRPFRRGRNQRYRRRAKNSVDFVSRRNPGGFGAAVKFLAVRDATELMLALRVRPRCWFEAVKLFDKSLNNSEIGRAAFGPPQPARTTIHPRPEKP